MKDDKLKEYKNKRNFNKTVEPEGKWQSDSDEPIFVIQKHDASTLHYDFRIEYDGVLLSWVIPKGPSTDPSVKRLALVTEDHPLDYANFEGNIPKGEYGAGSVIVWDRGTYRNISEKDGEKIDIGKALDKGHISVELQGEKLTGGYTLVRTGKGEKARWLFIKMKDEEADARRNPVSTEPKSVISGLTVEEIADK